MQRYFSKPEGRLPAGGGSPAGTMYSSMQILLYRFTPVPAEVLYLLVPPLQEVFGLPVHAVQRPLRLTARGYYPEREQWLARHLLHDVAAAPAPPASLGRAEPAARLGVAGQDLFATGRQRKRWAWASMPWWLAPPPPT